VNISEAQAQLPALVKRDSFTICRHGKPVGVFLSADRIAALLETLELLDDAEFRKSLARLEAGGTPCLTLAEAEAYWDHAQAPRRHRGTGRRLHRRAGA
jgi:PHD/YefM family antitoxin component YafN of YafNO toxin-antitoxin module